MSEAKPRIAFVSPRYGLEVNGGAEQYCRLVAEHLLDRYEVTVYNTCAVDYTTWANVYPEGASELNGVHVLRFPTARQRSRLGFGLINKRMQLLPGHTDGEERRWLAAQGPCCPALIEALKREGAGWRAVLFVTYLYYPTVLGMGLGLKNALLIPTLHDESAAYLRCFDGVFAAARGIVYNTPEERAFAARRFPFAADTPSCIAGLGIDPPPADFAPLPEALRGAPYLVYAGRIERGKGCGEMFEFFRRYKRERGGNLRLALMGKAAMEIPSEPDIVNLGFVSEEIKQTVMANSLALTLFSHFESLSIVVLESMNLGRPVLVSAHCDVLRGHCERSKAGLYFADYPGFAAAVDNLLAGGADYAALCQAGPAYVADNYRWDRVTARFAALIDAAGKE